MKIKEKLNLIYKPFLIIAICVIGGYTLLNWLLIIKLQVFSIKEMVINFWVPFVIPWIPILIWLRPKIKLLNLKNKRGDSAFLYQFIAALAITAPTIVAQTYIESASGKLSKLENIRQIESANHSKYYTVQSFYIDKTHIGVQNVVDVSGKNNQDFNMHLYVTLPILENASDTLNSICFAWLGQEYKKTIRNNLADEEKQKLFKEFAEESQKDFNQKDFNQFVYLNRVGNTDAADGFKAAVKNDKKYYSAYNNIFLAVNERFENHNGNKFAWIFLSLAIGAVIWLIMILIPKFDDEIVKRYETGEQIKETDWKETFSLLIPKEGYYITPIIMELNILIFILMVFSGLGFLSFNSTDLLNWGANYKPYTMSGEWWRLLSSTFLHGGLLHLFANMYGLLFVGIFLEPRLGKTKYALIYLTTGILASLASLWWHDATVSVGASGAIFGLYGIFLALLLTKVFPKDFSKAFLTSTLIFICYNLLMGFSGGIDNAAHIGGLVSGFVIGLLLAPSLKRESPLEEIGDGEIQAEV
jgi:membrane associated rhomboid family serine protease